jgi:endonuclease YncB( thermonuclease family)
MSLTDQYIRAVTDWEVIDGDTFRCRVELGFYISAYLSCRLIGINAPDHGEPGREEAKQKLFELLSQGPVTVHSIKADKFAGRFDAVVLVTPPDGLPLIVNQLMIEQGYAVEWDGTGKRPLVPWPPKAGA